MRLTIGLIIVFVKEALNIHEFNIEHARRKFITVHGLK